MRTKTPQQIIRQYNRLSSAIAAKGRNEVLRARHKRISRMVLVYMQRIYNIHNPEHKTLSVNESNYIFDYGETPVIDYINK